MSPDELKWNDDGLLPVVIADARSNAVLTLAYANREALERTIAERSTYLYSRSRAELWHKGATSGNTQEVVSVSYDCDGDALLYRVIPSGPACHTGAESCFYNEITGGEDMLRQAQHDKGISNATAENSSVTLSLSKSDPATKFTQAIRHLSATLKQRKTADPGTSYVAKLYQGGVDRIGKKIGEEATEVVIGAKNANHDELVWESADLLFHLMVLLEHTGVELDEVGAELLRRAK